MMRGNILPYGEGRCKRFDSSSTSSLWEVGAVDISQHVFGFCFVTLHIEGNLSQNHVRYPNGRLLSLDAAARASEMENHGPKSKYRENVVDAENVLREYIHLIVR